ncbi:MAG: ATP-dependent helicase [Pseudomonadota bacterium]
MENPSLYQGGIEMDSRAINTAFGKIKDCIDSNQNFVLQGGAGSGKTETLKQTLEFISKNYPNKKIACITHTNLAADEIKSRVGEEYTISTIHSFLNEFIKNYKKNLHKVIYELFRLDSIERQGTEKYTNEKEQKEKEHEKYKKVYEKYASFLYKITKERMPKVEGKRDYDKSPEVFNTILNEKINVLNTDIFRQIEARDYNQIEYNDTSFNSFYDLTFGHDGLLDITSLLFEKYPILGKILQDKFDCILIDEYQDTNEKTIKIFLEKLSTPDKTLIGLFGDSMQAIYSDGIGDNIQKYIDNKVLTKINKEDNYRCSQQVIDFINPLRNDSLKQEVAFKNKLDGTMEVFEDRQGRSEFYYMLYDNKPNRNSDKPEKDRYIQFLNALISRAIGDKKDFRQLKLTNKSIASDAGFGNLYEIFDERFTDNKEAMDRELRKLQISSLFELCSAYYPHPNSGLSHNYNLVLSKLKKQKFILKKISDKLKIKNGFDLIINSELGVIETINKAFELGLLKKSEQYSSYIEQKDRFFDGLSKDDNFKGFKKLYLEGKNTLNRISNDLPELDQYDFNELQKSVKKEIFYNALFSNELKFKEIINYFNYQNEYTQFITMHKTKGSEINNVLVVLEEYFWGEYDFRSIFSDTNDLEKRYKNQKLFYVACSRAKNNLKCVRLINGEEEEKMLLKYFTDAIKIDNLII